MQLERKADKSQLVKWIQAAEAIEKEGYTASSEGRSADWRKDDKGWWIVTGDNTYARNEWKRVDGSWYFFDETGYMATDWRKLGEDWYWLNPADGRMAAEEWIFDQNHWYYLGTGGTLKTGWLEYRGNWYYLSETADRYYGHMMKNETTPDGNWVNEQGIKQ